MSDKILEVRFKKTGRPFFVDPLKYSFNVGNLIVADSERGQEIARIVKILDKDKMPKDAKIIDIIHPAIKKDLIAQKENEQKAIEATNFCKQQAKKLGLKMKILLSEYTLDKSKLIIYFSAEERIDFRELVRILAAEYRARIELRQVGPRDEIKNYASIGMCGREVCCRAFLQDFEPVTIKMAKDQGMQINMSKLSGVCGRLMCCLKYEDEQYRQNLAKMPKIGDVVVIKQNKENGKVVDLDILNLKVKLRVGKPDIDERYEVYSIDDLSYKLDKVKVSKPLEIKNEEENKDN